MVQHCDNAHEQRVTGTFCVILILFWNTSKSTFSRKKKQSNYLWLAFRALNFPRNTSLPDALTIINRMSGCSAKSLLSDWGENGTHFHKFCLVHSFFLCLLILLNECVGLPQAQKNLLFLLLSCWGWVPKYLFMSSKVFQLENLTVFNSDYEDTDYFHSSGIVKMLT